MKQSICLKGLAQTIKTSLKYLVTKTEFALVISMSIE